MTPSEKGVSYIQKLFATVNNDDLLEFRIPPNAKGNMQLSDVLLRFVVKIPQTLHTGKIIPQNYFGAKQFGSLEIRINGEAVTRRNCSNEYFMASYFMGVSNYNVDYVTTGCNAFGIFDASNLATDFITSNASGFAKIISSRKGIADDFVYEIVLPIDGNIFTSNGTLPNNTPLDISFERSPSKVSLLKTEDFEISDAFEKVLPLEDAYLIVPYTIYPDSPIMGDEQIKYDDYVINRFNIPQGSANIRMANVLSGKLPSKLFIGIMSQDAYGGNFEVSSTLFQQHEVKKVTIYLDGNVITGFPITMSDSMVSIPYTRFLNNTNRYTNAFAGRMLTQLEFKEYHFIHSASFDTSLSGSLTFEFEFKDTPSDQLVLIACSVHDRKIQFDKFRNFKVL